MREEFRLKNLFEWENMLKELFVEGIPESKTWIDVTSIITVLRKVGSVRALNHLFFPHGGGLDLTGCKISTEPRCIELLFDGIIEIVKPISLTFKSFGEDQLEWAYFRLETGILEPSGLYKLDDDWRFEEVTEIYPGKYINRSVWDYGYYGFDEDGNEIPLSKSARVVTRCFDGAFVIFAKSSMYNRISATYDGRHNKMSAESFKKQIELCVDKVKNEA